MLKQNILSYANQIIVRRSFTTQSNKTVLIGGGSGFIGKALAQSLRKDGKNVLVISRSKEKGDLTWEEIEANGLPPCDAVINFAGKHILSLTRLWTQAYKDEVISSICAWQLNLF